MNPVYMGCLTILNVLFSIILLSLDYAIEFKAQNFYIIAGICIFINTIYLVDLIMNILVLGWMNMVKEKKILLCEILAQIA